MAKLNTLAIKLSLAFALVSAVTLLVVALLLQRSTNREFDMYLQHMGMMGSGNGWQQGPMIGMMGDVSASAANAAELEFKQRVVKALWISGGIALGVGLLLGAVVARQVAFPLKKLVLAASAVSQGKFSHRVDVKSKDEIGQLAVAFNSMASALEGQEQSRRQLIADISHELRTPLTVLQGNIEAMTDGVIAVDKASLWALNEDVNLLTRLVEDLRTLALADSGRLEVHPQAVDMGALVGQVAREYETKADSKGVRLSVEAPSDATKASVDPQRITQVLHNLMSNALRYTPAGGTVCVKVEPKPQGVQVAVSDTGSGIPQEDLPRVFERFYRADRSRSRDSGGSGLGLAIVKHIVEAHGGRVWVESAEGKGSEFGFVVPRSA